MTIDISVLDKLRFRSELSKLDDDTALEEEHAALYLAVSPKKMAEWRANGGGPKFIKPQDPKATGRNQPVSYVMRELRRFRASMEAGSNLEVARRHGLAGWVSGVEPFWADSSRRILGSALDETAGDWVELFFKAARKEIWVEWWSPREAANMTWVNPIHHKAFVEGYLTLLQREASAIKKCLVASEVDEEISRGKT